MGEKKRRKEKRKKRTSREKTATTYDLRTTYDRTRACLESVTQESGGWQKRSPYEYASRYMYTIAEPSWKGNNSIPPSHTHTHIPHSLSLSLSLFHSFSLFLALYLPLCSPCFSFYSRPRRPRHAQQTSPTVRSGRHAAFIMFPRSSFDGSTPEEASTAGGKQGQWRPLVGALSNRPEKSRADL